VLGALVLVRGASSRSRGGVALGVAVVAALFASRLRAPSTSPGWRLLEARESAYQSLRAVEGEDGGRTMRRLQVNEGFDSFQSVWQPVPGFLPEGYYYNLFALPPRWTRRPGAWRLEVLGLGAGTTWRVVEGALPEGTTLEASGVEIDPVVVALGEHWFDLPAADPARRVLRGVDARVGLRRLGTGLDEIVLDAYANQMEIPAHLCTREFFSEVRERLARSGWLCVNVGGFGLADPVVEAVAATAAAAFDRKVLALRVPFSRNCVLFARREADPPTPDGAGWYVGGEELDHRLSALAIAGAWRWFEPGTGPVLTDDRNPIDELQRESVERGRQLWFASR
jgi:spermidine synthase